jgi:hypothetical protein
MCRDDAIDAQLSSIGGQSGKSGELAADAVQPMDV